MFKSKEGFATTSYITETYLEYSLPLNTNIYSQVIDSSGNIYISQCSTSYDISLWEDNRIFKITTGAIPIITLYITTPMVKIQCMAFDSSHNLYINTGKIIYKITDGGSTMTHYAGVRGDVRRLNGPRLTAVFGGNIFSMAFDSADNLFMSEYSVGCITKISTDGEVSTYAGALPGVYDGITYLDGNGNSARFNYGLIGTVIDSTGNLFVINGDKIRKISTARDVTTILSITNPSAITIDSRNNLYVSWRSSAGTTISKISYNSTIPIILTSEDVLPIFSGFLLRDLLGNFYRGTSSPGRKFYLYKTTQTCLAGSYLNDGICELCPLGTYSAANATSCTECPVNTTTSSTGRTSASQCTSASAGYYVSNGNAILCPSNATCAGGTASFSCVAGYKKNTAGTGCELCPIGTYSAAGATTCTTCPVNTTTPSIGNTSSNNCTLVRSGYYMNGTTITQCPANTSCPGGPKDTTTTFTCANGYKTNAAGTACEECGVGFYGTGGICSECPANTTTLLTGHTLLSQCIAAAGYFLSGGTATACPANTTSSTGSTSQNQCIAAAGYFLSGGTAMPCPSNASCSGGSASFSCSNGYRRNTEGTGCEECGLGTWSSAGATSCTSCPPNTTTSLTARTSSNDCITSPGYYMSASGSVSCPSNANCAGGSVPFVCSNGYETRGSACISCGMGFYGTGGTCVPCSSIPATDSTAIWTTRAIGQTSCTPLECKPDYRMNALSNNCEPCPPNTRGLNCTNASPGYYMSNGVSILCPSNARCDGGSSSFLCSNGYETNSSSCVSCGVGFYGIDGRCVPCSSLAATDSTSTWTSRTTGQTSCTPLECNPDYRMNALSNNCEPCPPNTRGSNCTSASAGYYMSGESVLACPSNAFCSGELAPFVCSNGYETSGSACVSCGVGFYGTGGRCISCSTLAATDSTSTWTTRTTGQASCIADRCKPNYTLNEVSNNCEPCPSNTGGLNCTNASLGYYMNGSSVLPCPSNASCAGGSSPFTCSNDYIMNAASNGCDPCSTGQAGLNCTEAAPGYYLNGSSTVPCPSNAICRGGTASFTCSNGYYLNRRTGICDEITSCRSNDCSFLYTDHDIGSRLPTNYFINQLQLIQDGIL